MDAQTTALSALITSLVFFAAPSKHQPKESETVKAVESIRQSTEKILYILERQENERPEGVSPKDKARR